MRLLLQRAVLIAGSLAALQDLRELAFFDCILTSFRRLCPVYFQTDESRKTICAS